MFLVSGNLLHRNVGQIEFFSLWDFVQYCTSAYLLPFLIMLSHSPIVFSLGMLPNESLSQKFLSQNQIILWELVKISYKVILTQDPQSKFPSTPKECPFLV